MKSLVYAWLSILQIISPVRFIPGFFYKDVRELRKRELYLWRERENELIGGRLRSTWSSVPAWQRTGHGRRTHRRSVETPSSGSHILPSNSFIFSLLTSIAFLSPNFLFGYRKCPRKLLTTSLFELFII